MAAFRLLTDILTQMARGNAVTLMPIHAELDATGGRLAERFAPFLIRLIEDGQIPFRKVGTHRRIRFDDLMAYKQKVDQGRLKGGGRTGGRYKSTEWVIEREPVYRHFRCVRALPGSVARPAHAPGGMDLFRGKWTEAIHAEWIRSVLKNRPDLTRGPGNSWTPMFASPIADAPRPR